VRVLGEGPESFRLEVEDTGIGISESNIGRLFTAFQQLDSGAAKRHGGTGLGLALTKRLTEAQGGTVGVRRAVAQGSVFFASLPRRPAGFPKRGSSRSDVPVPARILVVESNAEDRRAVIEVLQQSGYAADAVSDCREALAVWQTHRYDALTIDFLDGQAEGMLALLDLIHQDPRGAQIPVIAMTLSADRSVATGFAVSDVLTKPVDPGQLRAALQRGGATTGRGRPVFVVDDDVASLKLMEASLAQLGYDSLCFSDARDALETLARVRPLAVVLDLIMPHMDGLAFLERFRTRAENRNVPIMVWTVKDLSGDERRSLQAAVFAVVQKGVEDSFRLSTTLQGFFGAGSNGGG
jgi:CheY-like chemotaxis protein